MNNFLEKAFRNLLTELRTFTDFKPAENTYYAMLRNNGYVSYFQLGKSAYGGTEMLGLDPNDPFKNLKMIHGKYVQEVEKNPELKAQADRLVKLGFLQIKDKEEKYPDITSKYHKDLFPTPEDVPAVTQQYANVKYDSPVNTLKVDHANKTIDLDANWLEYRNRRGDPRHTGASYQTGPSYVIPSGSTAFENNELGLQKMLKFLMSKDPRITSNYRIVGDEKYRNMTVGQLVKKRGEVESALTGLGKLIMFHGTSVKRWKTIQKTGLRPGAGGDVYADLVRGWSEGNVYLTFSHTNAENYATRQAIKDSSDAAVLKVEVPDVTKLVSDEDVLGWWTPKRTYNIKLKDKYSGEYISYEIQAGEGTSMKEVLRFFGHERVEMNEEGKSLYADVMHHVVHEYSKKSLKSGVIAYRGFIPPKFIKLDMTYTKTPFKTSEKKGGPDDEEYDRIRRGVQKTAKRYDEMLVRNFVRSLIS